MAVFVMAVFLLSDIEKTCFICVLEIIEPKRNVKLLYGEKFNLIFAAHKY